jgi:hypothetical protein
MFETPEERLLVQRCLERQPGAWESFLEKYSGVRYSTRDMLLNMACVRFQKLFFFSAFSD